MDVNVDRLIVLLRAKGDEYADEFERQTNERKDLAAAASAGAALAVREIAQALEQSKGST